MNHNETGQQPYTKVSLVFKFLHGSKRYFLISIAAALCVFVYDVYVQVPMLPLYIL